MIERQQLFADAEPVCSGADAQLDAVQPPYNLFEREIDVDVLPYAEDTGLTVLSYGALLSWSLQRADDG